MEANVITFVATHLHRERMAQGQPDMIEGNLNRFTREPHVLSMSMREEQVAWMRVEAHAKKYLKLRWHRLYQELDHGHMR